MAILCKKMVRIILVGSRLLYSARIFFFFISDVLLTKLMKGYFSCIKFFFLPNHILHLIAGYSQLIDYLQGAGKVKRVNKNSCFGSTLFSTGCDFARFLQTLQHHISFYYYPLRTNVTLYCNHQPFTAV